MVLSAQRWPVVPLVRPSLSEPPRLRDRVRAAIRARPYTLRTEEAYVAWIRRFILFHHKRHCAEVGEPEINHDDDLHSCPEPGSAGRAQPSRQTLIDPCSLTLLELGCIAQPIAPGRKARKSP